RPAQVLGRVGGRHARLERFGVVVVPLAEERHVRHLDGERVQHVLLELGRKAQVDDPRDPVVDERPRVAQSADVVRPHEGAVARARAVLGGDAAKVADVLEPVPDERPRHLPDPRSGVRPRTPAATVLLHVRSGSDPARGDEFRAAAPSVPCPDRPRGDAMPKPTPCLWFDTDGEDAARFYTSLFPNSRILEISHYGDANPSRAGQVMVVRFELDGQTFMALNGGPQYTFSEAVSFSIDCADQAEVDRYWEALTDGGEEGPCGWLKDRFGLSWQVVPTRLVELLGDPDADRAQRVMRAMMSMRK